MSEHVNRILEALKAATPEQLNKYNAPQKLIDAGIEVNDQYRSGNIQINLSNMGSTKPTDDEKSRYLLALSDIFNDAKIPVYMSTAQRRERQIMDETDGQIKKRTLWEAWPCLWWNRSAAQRDEAITELKAENAKLSSDLGQALSGIAELKALLTAGLPESLGEGVPNGNPVP